MPELGDRAAGTAVTAVTWFIAFTCVGWAPRCWHRGHLASCASQREIVAVGRPTKPNNQKVRQTFAPVPAYSWSTVAGKGLLSRRSDTQIAIADDGPLATIGTLRLFGC